jgi:hypothetical protein
LVPFSSGTSMATRRTSTVGRSKSPGNRSATNPNILRSLRNTRLTETTGVGWTRAWGNLKSRELVNLCRDTIDEVADGAEHGLDRIGTAAEQCFAFLRHAGFRL